MINSGKLFLTLILFFSLFGLQSCKEETEEPPLLSPEELSANADAALAQAGWSESELSTVDEQSLTDKSQIEFVPNILDTILIAASSAVEAFYINAGTSFSTSQALFNNMFISPPNSALNAFSASSGDQDFNAQTITASSKSISCSAGGTITLDGPLEYENTANLDTFSGKVILTGTIDISYNGCMLQYYTIFGKGKVRFQESREASSSKETTIYSDQQVPRTIDFQTGGANKFAAGLAVQYYSTKYKFLFSDKEDWSISATANFGDMVDQGGSEDSHTSMDVSYGKVREINGFTCTQSVTHNGTMLATSMAMTNMKETCVKN